MTATYPKGNAQVGDRVWHRVQGGPWEFDWTVVEVGVGRNQLEVRAGRPNGESRAFYPSFNSWQPEQWMVLPDPAPAAVAAFAARSALVVYRDGGNNDFERFRFWCEACQSPVSVEETCRQGGELRFDGGTTGAGGAFYQSKPEVLETAVAVICGCSGSAFALAPIHMYEGWEYGEDPDDAADPDDAEDPDDAA